MKPSRQASPLLKRRSSEPYHLRNKPSSVTHRDVLPAISTRVSRPIYGRKNLFYVILVILLCSYTQFKLLGPTRSHQLPAVQTGTPATQIVSDQLPSSQARFTLYNPAYEVLILRSSIQHQNDTWRHAIPSKHSSEWFVQNLAWLRVNEGGIRPDHKSISASCRRPHNEEAERVNVQADVDVLWTDIRDRGIGQDVMLLIECDISSLIRSKEVPSPMLDLVAQPIGDHEYGDPALSPLSSVIPQIQSLVLDFSFEIDLGIVETTSSGPRPLKLEFVSNDLALDFREPLEHVSMAVCLSPAFYENDYQGDDKNLGLKKYLWRWIEWREHMRKLGVERVNWYGRTEDMKDFVEIYNDIRGSKDIFRWAPPLAAHHSSTINPYHDQDAYLTDCVHANRDSSDYILILDLDEYPMVDFDHPILSPAQQWLEFMENLPVEAGSWEMTRIPMSSMVKKVTLSEELLYQDQLDCVNGVDDKMKSFYKSKSVLAVNQHKKTRMYPIGEGIARDTTMKPNWKFSGKKWDSNSNWPKLFHYRWFENVFKNGCTGPSPLKKSSGYARYLDELRANILEVKAQIEQEFF